MLDIKQIRENPDAIRRGAEVKRLKIDLDRLLALDQAIKPMQIEWETLQAERNSLSKTIGQAAPAERDTLKAKVQDVKVRMDKLTEERDGLKSSPRCCLDCDGCPSRETPGA